MRWHLDRPAAIAIYLFVLISEGSVYSRSGDSSRGPDNRTPDAIASVRNILYCAGDRDVYTIHLQLRLRYLNNGREKIILFKPNAPIEVTSGAIASTVELLRSKRYEVTLQYDQFAQPAEAPAGSRPNSSQFVIVQPGQSHEIPAAVSIPARFRASPAIAGTVAPGVHILALEIADWPFSPESGRELRKQWLRHGILQYRAITCEPFEVVVPNAPKLQNCGQ